MIRLSLAVTFLLLSVWSFGQETIHLQDAVHKKIIGYNISGSWDTNDSQEFLDSDGQYFGKCMTLTMRSKIDSVVWIYVLNGLMLMCEDTNTQDMIITKPVYVKLEPRQTKTVQLYAMCSEMHDGMPSKKRVYKVGKMANDDLCAITTAIDDMFMHNIVGQGAVWAYTDNATESDLKTYGADDHSLQMTIQVLNKADVTTKLNPPVKDSPPQESSKKSKQQQVPSEKVNTITVNIYLIYGAGGIILLLLGSTVWLLVGKSRNKKTTV